MPAPREVHQGRMLAAGIDRVFAPVHTAPTPQLLKGTAPETRRGARIRLTLVRWWQHGLVTSAVITAGGHARGDIEELRQRL